MIVLTSLLTYFIIKLFKTKKSTDVEKHFNTRTNLRKAFFAFLIWFISYIPWIKIVYSQAINISKDYWIPIPWMHDIIQEQISGYIEFLFTYNPVLSNIYKILFMIISLSIFGYIVYKLFLNHKNQASQ